MRLRSIPPITATGTRKWTALPLRIGSSLAFGSASRSPGVSPLSSRAGGYGYIYGKSSIAKTPDTVILARPSAAVNESIRDNGSNYLVRVDFPAPVNEDELRWVIMGDVLEIECSNPRYIYYRNFLVPNGALFEAERTPTSLLIRFDRGQKSPREKENQPTKEGETIWQAKIEL